MHKPLALPAKQLYIFPNMKYLKWLSWLHNHFILFIFKIGKIQKITGSPNKRVEINKSRN
jgi:hypothetical protein